MDNFDREINRYPKSSLPGLGEDLEAIRRLLDPNNINRGNVPVIELPNVRDGGFDLGDRANPWDYIFESNDGDLNVVPRPGMPSRTVTDINGRDVTIYGNSSSSSQTDGHAETIDRLAEQLARSGDYDYITIDRSWRTATGRVATSSDRPDVIGVRRDGRVDAWEVQSKTDSERELRNRLQEGLNTLPVDRQGNVEVIRPNVQR